MRTGVKRLLRRVDELAARTLAVAERAVAERAWRHEPGSRPAPELALAALGRRLLTGIDDALDAPDGRPRFALVRDLAAYAAHRDDRREMLARRCALEKLLASAGTPFTYPGYEGVPDRPAEFLVDLQYGAARDADGTWIPNFRERATSSASGLNSRQRAMALFVEQRLPPGLRLEDAAVYAMEAVTPFFEELRRRSPRAVGSEFLGDAVEPGTVRGGIRHEDVTRLSFADASFDLVVSNDVMEHVPDYRRGFAEVLRVLRPGGTLVFTVPFHAEQHEHVVRARVGPGGVEHLLPPEYHGDPVNPGGGVLCFQTFGWKLLDELRELGFDDTGAAFTWSYLNGMLGRELSMFYATKRG
jgi:SAM-dependent methyltransferase